MLTTALLQKYKELIFPYFDKIENAINFRGTDWGDTGDNYIYCTTGYMGLGQEREDISFDEVFDTEVSDKKETKEKQTLVLSPDDDFMAIKFCFKNFRWTDPIFYLGVLIFDEKIYFSIDVVVDDEKLFHKPRMTEISDQVLNEALQIFDAKILEGEIEEAGPEATDVSETLAEHKKTFTKYLDFLTLHIGEKHQASQFCYGENEDLFGGKGLDVLIPLKALNDDFDNPKLLCDWEKEGRALRYKAKFTSNGPKFSVYVYTEKEGLARIEDVPEFTEEQLLSVVSVLKGNSTSP